MGRIETKVNQKINSHRARGGCTKQAALHQRAIATATTTTTPPPPTPPTPQPLQPWQRAPFVMMALVCAGTLNCKRRSGHRAGVARAGCGAGCERLLVPMLTCSARAVRSARPRRGCAREPEAPPELLGRARCHRHPCSGAPAASRTSSAAYLSTAVNGASSGTLNLRARGARQHEQRRARQSASERARCSGARRCECQTDPEGPFSHSHSVWELGVRSKRDLEGHLAPADKEAGP